MDGSPETMSQLIQGGVKNLSGNFSAALNKTFMEVDGIGQLL